MLKAIIIGEVRDLPAVQILATVAAGAEAVAEISRLQPDIVIFAPKIALQLNSEHKQTRGAVVAQTRQGMQVVPSAEIIYFHAEQKYVVMHHINGQTLIDDTLNSLEQEFAAEFVRIHRNALVARNRIESLHADANGQQVVKLRGVEQEFPVSRRQLPKVRKALKQL